MLCLGQKICRNVSGSCGLIRQHQNFTWAGNGINADIAVHCFFGKCYENITGAGDLVYLRNRRCAESHGSDGLCSANLIDGIHTGDISSYQSSGIDFTVFSGRGGHNDLIYTGYFRRDHIHQYTGRISGFSTGNIDTRPLNGGDLHT